MSSPRLLTDNDSAHSKEDLTTDDSESAHESLERLIKADIKALSILANNSDVTLRSSSRVKIKSRKADEMSVTDSFDAVQQQKIQKTIECQF